MTVVQNHALRRLREGKLAVCLSVRLSRTVDIAHAAKSAGFDCLLIDCEHSAMNLDTAAQISSAALAIGITPLVRVAGHEHWQASRLLDNGAQGIVFPSIETADEAFGVATACRFPPTGTRSMGGGLTATGFAPIPVADAARLVNDETMVVAMIESARGVDQCEAIAAVDGVDGLLVGTNDLCLALGIPGQFEDARVADAYARVIAACRRHGKFAGAGAIANPELLERYIGMGVQLVLTVSDLSLILQGGRAHTALLQRFGG